jgi:hypothetical protein
MIVLSEGAEWVGYNLEEFLPNGAPVAEWSGASLEGHMRRRTPSRSSASAGQLAARAPSVRLQI